MNYVHADTSTMTSRHATGAGARTTGRRRSWRGWLVWLGAIVIYGATLLLLLPLSLIGRLRRKPATADGGRRILVIGTFYTRNWANAHLRPLIRAGGVAHVTAVVDGPLEPIPGVKYVLPPAHAKSGIARAAHKALLAVREAAHTRPHLVMGYHLLPCAMIALLVGRLNRAKTGYQLTAGPIELLDGGSRTENFFLKRLEQPSRLIERLAFALARRFDLLVVRGTAARRELRARGVTGRIEVVTGSIELTEYATPDERNTDIVSVCRLVDIKQPHHIVSVLHHLATDRPNFKALILGDGPLRRETERQARSFGIADRLTFMGHVDSVQPYLADSKIFLLTSRSEGLSIAMAEAMGAGCVPVVADVGDLRDLVENGVTGFRVPPGDFEAYADAIQRLLSDDPRRVEMSNAAQRAARAHTGVTSVADRWQRAVSDISAAEDESRPAARPSRAPLTRQRLWEHTPNWVRRVATPAIHAVPPGAFLGKRFRRFQRRATEAAHWSQEQQDAYTLERLRVLLAHAAHSPYYARLFDDAGVNPDRVETLAELERLPFLSADDVREHGSQLQTTDHNADFISTGGTGGAPLSFYINADRSAFEYGHLVAAWRRAGYTPTIAQAVFRGNAVPPRDDEYRYDPILRRHYFNVFHMSDSVCRAYLRRIAEIGPCFLQGYPSALCALARCVARDGSVPPPNIRGILAGSENLFPQQRAMLTETFGVRVFSWYGQTEKVVLATECESSSDYHVLPTYGRFELISSAGRPISQSGERGEIVGTGFANTVTPFIRYRTGDFATFVGDQCSACGRREPIIRDVRGHREQEYLVSGDGTLISWTALNMHDDTFRDVRRFQFEQHEPGEAVLHVAPAPGFSDDSQRRIHRALDRKLRHLVNVRLTIGEDIPLSPRGKSQFVKQHLDTGSMMDGTTT